MKRLKKSDLIGSWKLITFFLSDEYNNRIYPLGEKVSGRLIYTEHKMCGMMFNAALEPLSTEFVAYLDCDEKSRLAESFIGYSGDWSLRNDSVLHIIEMSYIPNQKKREEVRYYSLDAGVLSLRTDPISINGTDFVGTVVWEKE